jgi:ribosome-binding protein aMBF1 (putative translation factor)
MAWVVTWLGNAECGLGAASVREFGLDSILEYSIQEFTIERGDVQGLSMERSIFTGDYQVLVELLVETRKGVGVRQVDLAKSLAATQSFVSKIERGELRLDVIQLRAVCLALDTTLGEFVEKLEKRLEGGLGRKRNARR